MMPESDSAGLLSAMLAVQAAAPTLKKDATANVATKGGGSYSYSYTKLDTIVEQVGPLLSSNGLVWTTMPGRASDGEPVLKYRLAHAPSSETLEGEMPLLLASEDPQAQGSAITYARRYALCAVLNLVADDDDDGAHATRTRQYGGGTASDNQKKLVRRLFTEKGVTKGQARELLRGHGVDVGDDDDPREAVDRLRWPGVSKLIDELKARLPPAEQKSDVPTNLDDFVHGRGDVEGLPID